MSAITPTWAPGPLNPTLGDGAVHVWRADLAQVMDDVCELLCEDELERAERMLDERDGQLWRRSRGVLRALLGRYLRQEPRSLRFIVGAHGKPALAGDAAEPQAARRAAPEAASRLSFNLSHSGHLALYAFSESGDVGVDVEVTRRPMNELAIAARVFGTAQAKRLQELDPDSRRREFLRAWVRHEAERKCLGVGLFGGEDAGERRRPSLTDVEVGSDAAGALATHSPVGDLRCLGWR
jgi:4'-phosphopantetheinyl transferase